MEFGIGNDTTPHTTDFCPRQLVMDLLRGKWCNGFWPLRRWHRKQQNRKEGHIGTQMSVLLLNKESARNPIIIGTRAEKYIRKRNKRRVQ